MKVQYDYGKDYGVFSKNPGSFKNGTNVPVIAFRT